MIEEMEKMKDKRVMLEESDKRELASGWELADDEIGEKIREIKERIKKPTQDIFYCRGTDDQYHDISDHHLPRAQF